MIRRHITFDVFFIFLFPELAGKSLMLSPHLIWTFRICDSGCLQAQAVMTAKISAVGQFDTFHPRQTLSPSTSSGSDISKCCLPHASEAKKQYVTLVLSSSFMIQYITYLVFQSIINKGEGKLKWKTTRVFELMLLTTTQSYIYRRPIVFVIQTLTNHYELHPKLSITCVYF